MELSLITPIAHLDFTYLLPGRFCIGTVAAKSLKYRSFFQDAARNGYTVILDTGTFEDDFLTLEKYLELTCLIQPKIVVAPDIIGAVAKDGWEATKAFREQLVAYWENYYDATCFKTQYPEVMFVPQTQRGERVEFEEVLCDFIDTPDTDIRWLGICRDAVYNAYGKYTGTKDQELNRFYFSAWLQQSGLLMTMRNTEKKIHFLGIGDRIDLLEYYWFVDSMDTASFFWQGYNGSTVNMGRIETFSKRPRDYFTRPYPEIKERKEIIETNCSVAAYFAECATAKRKDKEGTRL